MTCLLEVLKILQPFYIKSSSILFLPLYLLTNKDLRTSTTRYNGQLIFYRSVQPYVKTIHFCPFVFSLPFIDSVTIRIINLFYWQFGMRFAQQPPRISNPSSSFHYCSSPESYWIVILCFFCLLIAVFSFLWLKRSYKLRVISK